MAKTVVGVFDRKEQAEQAVHQLKDEGYTEREISVVAKGEKGGDQGGGNQGGGLDMSEGLTWGGALGGVAGLLAGVGALAIPGLGPLVAAGPLAATLSGAATGGIAGGLLDMGIPEERGNVYEDEVRQGRILCAVEVDDGEEETAESILRDNGAREVESHSR
ncbi:general stress protein [Limnochorda pilosa]|uniref:Membrane protein n=1 Tax=Limnochorda pilosa TaxID=1555112 RepID=A0A0K2SMR4_LIMPI|nr:general stress protein [Limnochorda pilosa]BAS28400.1 membrane protein [Limnochorda pilosa]